MKVIKKTLGPLDTNFYIIYDEKSKNGIIIDAPLNSFKIFEQFYNKYKILVKNLFITHGHWDHIVDCSKFEKKNIKINGHIGDKRFYQYYKIIKINHIKIENFALNYFNSTLNNHTEMMKIDIIHTPGHSPGSVIYYLKNYNMAFTGDVIFEQSIGRIDLPGGNKEELLYSIKNVIYKLPLNTMIYPGHGNPFKVKDRL